MFRKKIYGQSKVDKCPFCDKQATVKNPQGIIVCKEHKDAIMNDLKCICGDYLEVKEGKWGYFFLCHRCGAQNPRKILDINIVKDVSKPDFKETKKTSSGTERPKKKEELFISSDDVDYF